MHYLLKKIVIIEFFFALKAVKVVTYVHLSFLLKAWVKHALFQLTHFHLLISKADRQVNEWKVESPHRITAEEVLAWYPLMTQHAEKCGRTAITAHLTVSTQCCCCLSLSLSLSVDCKWNMNYVIQLFSPRQSNRCSGRGAAGLYGWMWAALGSAVMCSTIIQTRAGPAHMRVCTQLRLRCRLPTVADSWLNNPPAVCRGGLNGAIWEGTCRAKSCNW